MSARLGPPSRALAVPVLLAVAYLVLLAIRMPQIIGWEGTESDNATAYLLGEAIAHGHTGIVMLNTQGSWISLGWAVLTAGLGFHRVLWELSPALLTLVGLGLVASSTRRVAGRAGAALAVALVVAASPIALRTFTSPFDHNTTVPGAALLGAYLLWLTDRPRTAVATRLSVLAMVLAVGGCVASDALLLYAGLVPFALTASLVALRTGERRVLGPAVAVSLGGVLVSVLVTLVMRRLGFMTVPPTAALDLPHIPVRAAWLVEGLLRLGNGLIYAPHSPLRAPLMVAAALATLGALAAVGRLAARTIRRLDRSVAPTRAVHIVYWSACLLCSAVAYVVSSAAPVPSDRYLIVAVPAVACLVPLLATGRAAARTVAAGAVAFAAASLVSLAAGDMRHNLLRADVARQANAIAAITRRLHLPVGYAGYWDATSLDWTSGERLHVYPVTGVYGALEPMDVIRVAAWYRPRPHTPSYLLLAPGDNVLADRLPAGLPRPARVLHIGLYTMAIYPFDIAAVLHAPHD